MAPTVTASPPSGTLILGCGALAKELLAIVELNQLDHVTVECLPAILHNRPDRIVPELAARVERARKTFDQILIGYADCGTGGLLDVFCEEQNLTRLPGAHCYEFFAGHDRFMELHERELGTFYLTDYLTTHFERLIWEGLGIAKHPELFDMYFGNYKRLVLLSQVPNPRIAAAAQAIADRMGLAFSHEPTGYGELRESIVDFTPSRNPRSQEVSA